jgi:MarR family transcriptional regulator, transcriptional regulator for hemolysin
MSVTTEPIATNVKVEDCPECLLGNLNWLLTQAHYGLATELAVAFEPLGITPRGHAVLGAAQSGEFTQKHLANLVGLDKTTMVALIDDLEAAGLVKRLPSVADRRAHLIQLTAEGRRKYTAASKIAKRVQADVLGSLPADEAGALMDALGSLVRDRLAEPIACKSIRRREPGVRAL